MEIKPEDFKKLRS